MQTYPLLGSLDLKLPHDVVTADGFSRDDGHLEGTKLDRVLIGPVLGTGLVNRLEENDFNMKNIKHLTMVWYDLCVYLKQK